VLPIVEHGATWMRGIDLKTQRLLATADLQPFRWADARQRYGVIAWISLGTWIMALFKKRWFEVGLTGLLSIFCLKMARFVFLLNFSLVFLFSWFVSEIFRRRGAWGHGVAALLVMLALEIQWRGGVDLLFSVHLGAACVQDSSRFGFRPFGLLQSILRFSHSGGGTCPSNE